MATKKLKTKVTLSIANNLTRQFATGATRDGDSAKLDYDGFLSPIALRRFAEYMHSKRTANVPAGQTLRDSDNWQKGIPLEAYRKSLHRHQVAVWLLSRGYTSTDEKGNPQDLETELCGLLFNVQGMLHEIVKAGL